jgi:hypothetical protein
LPDISQAIAAGAARPPVDVSTTGTASGSRPEQLSASSELSQNRYVQFFGGLLGGVALGIVPYAGFGHAILDVAGVLPHGSPEARWGLGLGQMLGGFVAAIGGAGGTVLGGLASTTGIGAAIGVPAAVVSVGVITGGVANVMAGYRLLTTGSGSANKGAAGGPRAGMKFTQKGKQDVLEQNRGPDGTVKCANCGVETVPAQRSERGVAPRSNEVQVDHVHPRSRGGNGSSENGQPLCRTCNRQKGDKLP